MTSSLVRRPLGVPAFGARWLLGLALLTLAGCELPNYKGPQIQEPPTGFFINPEAVLDRELFPEKEIVYRDAWVNTSWGEVSTIHITGHPGVTMRAEVHDAYQAAEAAATEPVTFSALRDFTIDERTGWGWHERLQTPELGISWVAFRVVIPYDTITYSIELYSGDPTFKGVPDTLAAIASTFAVGETDWNVPLLLVIAALLAFALNMARKRAQARQLQMQSIQFVKIKKEEKGEEGMPRSGPTEGTGQAPGEP